MAFRDKVVVVTGATGGMGRALCRRFGAASAKIALLDLHQETLETFAHELSNAGIHARGLPCDVTDEQACQAAMRQIVEKFGGIDVLINNAGITHRSAFEKTLAAGVEAVKCLAFQTSFLICGRKAQGH